MNNLLRIFTLSKEIDDELLKTSTSLIESSKKLDKKSFNNFKYLIVIKNHKECYLLDKIRKLLILSQINFEIIPQSSINQTNKKRLITNGWYEALYEILIRTKNNPYLWLLNSGDYANKNSLLFILRNIDIAQRKNIIGISFLTNVIHKNYFFTNFRRN